MATQEVTDDVDLEERVLRQVALGKTFGEVALKLGLDTQTIVAVVNNATNRVRDHSHDVAAEAFMVQCVVLRRWLAILHTHIEKIAASELPFDDRPFRVAVAVCDRQAKLLGFDKDKRGDAADKGDWIKNAPFEQVLVYAKQMNYNLPTKFDTEYTGGR